MSTALICCVRVLSTPLLHVFNPAGSIPMASFSPGFVTRLKRNAAYIGVKKNVVFGKNTVFDYEIKISA